MNLALTGFAASLLATAAWHAERAAAQLERTLDAAATLRHEVLDDPRRAIPEYCAGRPSRQPDACLLQLGWRVGDLASTFADVCDGTAPSEDDPRLAPRRYYELKVDCPALVPGQGRRRISAVFTR